MRLGIQRDNTYLNWEKGKTQPVAAQFRRVVAFLGYDPSPAPETLAGRLQAKGRTLRVTFSQVAQYLGWDEGSLTRYLNGKWRLSSERATALERVLSADGWAAADIREFPRRPRR